MSDVLEKIIADKRRHVEKLKAAKPFDAIDREAREAARPRPFETALRAKAKGDEVGLITEIKKASPSAGVIREDFSPAKLAQAYEAGGAACLSVLTDEPYFQGRNQDLIEARKACALPVLRKDFMIDVWQVAEARAIGADCILIIMAALKDSEAKSIYQAAIDYGMDVLIETHNRVELDRALALPTGMIGINNRNLKTLSINLQTTEELRVLIPPDRLVVSESGLSKPEDLARMQKIGVNCFLVGESLLKQPDVTTATLELRLN
ncbi:MAG TPA: indole-3-glycerol phosphate synthase TrpC [Alphaproteobacteria bacterium]|nr:indole-3-glycerol phosphate synthase TrpC [Alphaproteobacteria bacterium]